MCLSLAFAYAANTLAYAASVLTSIHFRLYNQAIIVFAIYWSRMIKGEAHRIVVKKKSDPPSLEIPILVTLGHCLEFAARLLNELLT